MKRIIAITVLLSAFSIAAISANYEEAMKTNIEKINQLKSSKDLAELAANFQRIANAEKDKWLPGYYAAYCYLNTTFFDELKSKEIHEYLDLAQAEIDKVQKIAPKESEIFALQAFVYQLRITDMSKGYKYSSLATEAINTAEKLNSENPRVYYLRGSNTFHTPKMFGGGAEKAKPDLEKAAKMFEAQKLESEISPSWGAAHNGQLLKQCE
jgi:hypothetical protein